MAFESQSIEQVDAELRRVGEATDGLVRSAQELRAALDALSESVRAAVREASVPVTPALVEQPRMEPPPVDEAAPEDPRTEYAAVEPVPVEDAPDETPPPVDGAGAETDLEAARIVALNMVLDGKARDEVAAHLRDELGVSDSDSLLDDVYARVG